jgi:hypothetical protein
MIKEVLAGAYKVDAAPLEATKDPSAESTGQVLEGKAEPGGDRELLRTVVIAEGPVRHSTHLSKQRLAALFSLEVCRVKPVEFDSDLAGGLSH